MHEETEFSTDHAMDNKETWGVHFAKAYPR